MEKILLPFQRFAENEAKGKSPLYEFWCKKIVTHEALLHLIGHIPDGQPKPNLFFASVQYLSLKKGGPLKSIFEEPNNRNFEESFHLLEAFCIEHQYELIKLFQTKLVQTNEVQRATFLYPIFSEIAATVNKPLTLIEIGTSAGLLLNLDNYHYQIKQRPPISFGNTKSPLTLQAENLSHPLHQVTAPVIKSRIGIDLNVIDLDDEQQYEWLQCLIWPELKQRKRNLEKALKINRQCAKELYTGDFRQIIPELLQTNAYNESQIVIFHTHVANQFTMQLKNDLVKLIELLSNNETIYHVYNNMYDTDLHVDLIENNITTSIKTLKNTDSHGNYFYWE